MATSSKTSKFTHAVIAWEKQGEEELGNELIEAISLNKIIVKGERNVGSDVCMQYKKELWSGSILSLHDSKGAAIAASKNDVVPASNSSGLGTKRKRTTKTFGEEYVDRCSDHSVESDEELEPDKKVKKSGSNVGKTSGKKTKQTGKDKDQQLNILSNQLSVIENSILLPEAVDLLTDSDSLESDSEILDSSVSLNQDSITAASTPKKSHPQIGGKCPKSHAAPRCINLKCREDREVSKKEIQDLKLKVEKMQEELRCRTILRDSGKSFSDSDGEILSGKLPRDVAISHGFTELMNGQCIWICPSKLTAAVKDAENKSRKVLGRSLLSIFYSGEQLENKSLPDLDKDIVESCVDFAMVAKLPNVPNVKKAEIRQALRCKLNSLRFSKNKPGYYKEYRKTKNASQ